MNGRNATHPAAQVESLRELVNRTGSIEFSPANVVAWQDELAKLQDVEIVAWYGDLDAAAQERLFLVLTRVLAVAEVMELCREFFFPSDRIIELHRKVEQAEEITAALVTARTRLENALAEERETVSQLGGRIRTLQGAVAQQAETHGGLWNRARDAEAKLARTKEALAAVVGSLA